MNLNEERKAPLRGKDLSTKREMVVQYISATAKSVSQIMNQRAWRVYIECIWWAELWHSTQPFRMSLTWSSALQYGLLCSCTLTTIVVSLSTLHAWIPHLWLQFWFIFFIVFATVLQSVVVGHQLEIIVPHSLNARWMVSACPVMCLHANCWLSSCVPACKCFFPVVVEPCIISWLLGINKVEPVSWFSSISCFLLR